MVAYVGPSRSSTLLHHGTHGSSRSQAEGSDDEDGGTGGAGGGAGAGAGMSVITGSTSATTLRQRRRGHSPRNPGQTVGQLHLTPKRAVRRTSGELAKHLRPNPHKVLRSYRGAGSTPRIPITSNKRLLRRLHGSFSTPALLPGGKSFQSSARTLESWVGEDADPTAKVLKVKIPSTWQGQYVNQVPRICRCCACTTLVTHVPLPRACLCCVAGTWMPWWMPAAARQATRHHANHSRCL